MKAEWLVCIALPKEPRTGDWGGGEETKVIVHKAFSRRDRSEAAAALEINT